MEINAKWGNVAAEKNWKEFISCRSDLGKNSYFNVCEIENAFIFKESWDLNGENVYDLKLVTLNLIAFFKITWYVYLKLNIKTVEEFKYFVSIIH